MSRSSCSFCAKTEFEVRQIVAGPDRVGVCNECVALFADITRDEFEGNVLVSNIGELVTNDPLVPGLLGTIDHAAVAVVHGVVVWAGPSDSVPERWRELPTLDVEGRAVVPGFVDAHTHALFGGDASDEYANQLAVFADPPLIEPGVIVRATAATSDDHLFRETTERLNRMLALGTTTLEIKSGFGMTTAAERRLLGVLSRVADTHPIDLVPTLFFRAVPEGADRVDHVKMITEELLALAAPLATYCDVYCDDTGFSLGEAYKILTAAAEYGLPARLHAQRFGPDDSVQLAAAVSAVSADHLDHLTRAEAAILAESGTVAVLLPGSSFGLRSGHAPARMIWESGTTVAIATDCGPDGPGVESMQLIVALATLEMGLTPAQAVWSATRGGALALEEPEKGWLGRGAVADFVVLDAPRANHLVQRPGTNLAWRVFKDGSTVA